MREEVGAILMTGTAVISLGRFIDSARKVADFLGADLLLYDKGAFASAFRRYRSIVAVMSAGIAVRGIAPLLSDKWADPAVVAISPDLRFAIPLVGGHHGANQLAKKLEKLGMMAAVSTATEAMGKEAVELIAERTGTEVLNRRSTRQVNAAMLNSDVPLYMVEGPGIVVAGPGVSILLKKGEYVGGIGCRKGTGKDDVRDAIARCLADAGIALSEVMAFATTDRKRHEKGLIDAIHSLGANLVFLDDETINAQPVEKPSKAIMLGLRGVAEPCALAISRRKEIIMEKKAYGNVTIAIAR
ncbi:cobalt-precorrin 5A hydrolase [Methanocella conradii]|uniref:cobalt-precorrin 5A hydrolase n=1 Tax=Methanocella conradii TaxID=1175444 RepID=UPI0024B37995|nr:cobalt-precorrin 5A hydrolase [Methanocella conradii]MDI6896262.1 cobalt-precorrin 5A hydrolase [Methanocella conradii]